MKSICVFCGSSPGVKLDYTKAAELLGRTLAARKITLVYGGAKVGIMGKLANACLDGGGEVVGVITKKLVGMGVAYENLAHLHIVDTMHERKAKMAELSDGFITLPGGLGTMEEFFEIVSLAQLGIHVKPCGLLNICGYFDKLLSFLNQTVDQQFVKPADIDMIQIDESPEELLKKFENYQAPKGDKAAWIIEMTKKVNGI